MSASDARPIPQKNTAYRVTFPIFDADGDLVSGAAGLDSEISKDGGAFSDCANEATEIGSSGIYYLDLTAAEMNADTVAIIVQTTTTGAKTTPIILYPEEAGDIRVNITQISGDATAADNLEADYDGTGYNKSNSTIGTAAALGAQAKADVNAEVVDVLRTDTIPDSYAADGAQPTIAQAVLAIHQFLQERAVSGTTVTIKKPDGSTTAMTFTLDDGTNPTSITRAT